jgi:hypothetical protein
MKLFVIKSQTDQFQKAAQVLERDLTPQERKWLILAEELLRRAEKRRFLNRLKPKAV